MKFDNNILNELQTLSPLLAGLQRKSVFSVPEGYFETLSETVLIGIKEEAGIINTTKALDVPQGYFDNLSSAILDKIKAQQKNTATDELKALSPLLYSMQHKNVFEVPQGYFTTVPANVLHAVKATPAKVVRMPKPGSFLKYAAAAVIIGVMALGVYKYADKPSNPVPAVSFAKLDSSSIEKGKRMNVQQFNEALNNLSEDDITSYLEKNGSEEDISLLTSSIEVNDLPNKNEYLLDEKTLENYLDKIELQN